MATFTSFASIKIPNLQSGDRRSIFRPNSSKKILKLSRCNVENSTSNSSNNTSTSSQDSESENLLLKMAWYGSEFLGIAASIFRSPTGTEAPSEGNLELATDGSGLVDRALVVDTIKDDFQRSYFVTGNLTLDAYEEKCEFADPAGSFKGLSRFKRNCTNFGYLVETSNMKLMKWEDFEVSSQLIRLVDRLDGFLEKVVSVFVKYRTRQLVIGVLVAYCHFHGSPFFQVVKPLLLHLQSTDFISTLVVAFNSTLYLIAATGYTEYYFNEKSGKVCRHIEHWNVPKMALLKQIIRPSRGKKASG